MAILISMGTVPADASDTLDCDACEESIDAGELFITLTLGASKGEREVCFCAECYKVAFNVMLAFADMN